VTARSAADLARVNRKTAAYFFHRLRQIIARQLEDSLPVEGLVEVDESYFGGVRKGKRGRGAAGKVPVFGILKRGGKVHTVMIPDVRKDTLPPIIRQKVVPDSIVYTDSYPAYDVPRRLRVPPPQDRPLRRLRSRSPQSHQRNRKLLEPGQAHPQPIQRHSESPLSLFLKETEFRFNYGTPSQQLRTLKRWAKLKTRPTRSGTAPFLYFQHLCNDNFSYTNLKTLPA
jgi:transposase